MTFSFCLNKDEMLTLCGLGLLYQGLDMKPEGSLVSNNQRMVCAVIEYLERDHATEASDFKKLAYSLMPIDSTMSTASRRSSHNDALPPKGLHTTVSPIVAARSIPETTVHDGANGCSTTGSLQHQQEQMHRATVPDIGIANADMMLRHTSVTSDATSYSSTDSLRSYSGTTVSPVMVQSRPTAILKKEYRKPNLDYLSLNSTPDNSQPQSPAQPHSQEAELELPSTLSAAPLMVCKTEVGQSEWENMLGGMDDGQQHIYDAMYTDAAPGLDNQLPTSTSFEVDCWSPIKAEGWDFTSLTMSDYNPVESQSVLSFSEESLSSGDDNLLGDMGSQDLGMSAIDDLFLEDLGGPFGL